MLYSFVLYPPAKPAARAPFLFGPVRLDSPSPPSLYPLLMPAHIIARLTINAVVDCPTIVHAAELRAPVLLQWRRARKPPMLP